MAALNRLSVICRRPSGQANFKLAVGGEAKDPGNASSRQVEISPAVLTVPQWMPLIKPCCK